MPLADLKGIGLFSMNVLHLISIGKHESIEDVETHFAKKDLVEYLYSKYENDFLGSFDNRTYNYEALNQCFYKYSDYIIGNEHSKYGIENDYDGLLLILSLIMNKVEESLRE